MLKETTTNKYIVICTRCGDLFIERFATEQEIINEIVRCGWDVIGNTHICENCIDELLNTRGKQREDYQAFVQVVRDFIRQNHLSTLWNKYVQRNGYQKIIEKIAKEGK